MTENWSDRVTKHITDNVQRITDTLRTANTGKSDKSIAATVARDRDFKDDAEIVSDAIMEQFSPESVFEIGCGIGLHLKPFLDNGITANGIDESKVAHENAVIPKRKIKIHPLNDPYNPGDTRDLVICIDLLEYTSRSREDALIATIANAGHTAVVSVPLPRYSSLHYEHEEPQTYWEDKFQEHGLIYDLEATQQLQGRIDAADESWVPEQLMVFQQT